MIFHLTQSREVSEGSLLPNLDRLVMFSDPYWLTLVHSESPRKLAGLHRLHYLNPSKDQVRDLASFHQSDKNDKRFGRLARECVSLARINHLHRNPTIDYRTMVISLSCCSSKVNHSFRNKVASSCRKIQTELQSNQKLHVSHSTRPSLLISNRLGTALDTLAVIVQG